jgi:hypothetical protein
MLGIPVMSALKTLSFCFALLFLTVEFAAAANPQAGVSTAAGTYFGGSNTFIRYQPARRSAPAPQPMDISGRGKPFENLYRQPTVSPYLALDLLNDEGTGLPNYYAFYKPQQERQQANEAQEARIRRLQQQLRMTTAAGAISRNSSISRISSGGMPTTGTSSQFMNLGGYFPGLR